MTDRPLDAERVAALLDGRLSAQERAQVLAQLAKDPAWREVAADVGAVLGEEPSTSDAEAAPEDPTRSAADIASRTLPRRWGAWLGLAVAASLCVFVLTRDGAPPRDGPASLSPAVATTVVLGPDERAQLVQDRWSVVRAATQVLGADAIAVRLGALSVDAFLDRESGGAEAITEMRELLATVDGAAAASRLLAAAGDSAARDAAFAVVRALVPSDAYDAGVWLELRRVGVYGDVDGLAMVRRVAERRSVQAEDEAALQARLDALQASVRRGDVRAVRDAATAVLRAVGS